MGMINGDFSYVFPVVSQGSGVGGGGSAPVIAPLSVTENGTYTPPSGVDGYAPVEVNVASSGGTAENRLAMLLSDTLTEVTAADFGSATKIENYLFNQKKNLVSVDIPNSVTSIGSYAFGGCKALASITIPNGVTSIGDHAFYGCNSLTNITIPDGVTSIGDYALGGCGMTSIVIPDGVRSLATGVLLGCNNLASVVIGKGVTSIGLSALQACDSLTSIILPENVKTISISAFDNSSYLSTIVLRSDSVVSLKSASAFSKTPFATNGTGGTCYVPQALIESYKTATNWSALYEAGTCNFVAIEGSEYE